GDYALEFDGQSKVEIPGMKLDLSKPFTIEAYLTQTAVVELPEGQWASPIYSINRVGITSGYIWGMRLIGQHDEQLDHILERPTIVNGKKTHVAAVSTGQELLLFVDGQLAVRKDVKSNPPATVRTSLEMGYAFRGQIDEMRISKVPRYTADFKPTPRFEPDASTLGLYHCDEGQSGVLQDASASG